MDTNFNFLEIAILECVKEIFSHEKTVSDQLNAAIFIKREWSKVGYFVYFDVSKTVPQLDLDKLGGSWPLLGPEIISDEVHSGGSSILWGDDGYFNCLEMYSYGNHFGKSIKIFELICPTKLNKDS